MIKIKLKTGVPVTLLLLMTKKIAHQLKTERKKTDKYEQLYKMMVQWMEIKQNGQSVGNWLNENHYQKIVIYGLYLIGERLYIELSDENVNVVYGIDKKDRNYLEGIKVYRPTDPLPEADVILVTAVAEFEKIRNDLQGKIDCPVLSLQDILNEVSIS